MTQGRIAILDHVRGMYAVQLSNGGYTVFELLDSNELSSGDVISGALDEHGGCTLKNLTEDEEFEAFVEQIGTSLEQAKKGTFLF
jgi:hypothetical protein